MRVIIVLLKVVRNVFFVPFRKFSLSSPTVSSFKDINEVEIYDLYQNTHTVMYLKSLKKPWSHTRIRYLFFLLGCFKTSYEHFIVNNS